MSVRLNDTEYQIGQHALERMSERGITEGDIQSCLANFDVKVEPAEGYHLYISDHPNGKRLQVVLNTRTREIVSVVWLD